MKPSYAKFLKERYEHDEHYFTIYDTYTPNYKRPVVSAKFYSKYDALDLSHADPVLVETIKMARDKGPKDKYPWPVTSTQVYGWFSEPLVQVDRNDDRFYHPTVVCDITKHELRIRMDKSMKLPKFTGIPFKL